MADYDAVIIGSGHNGLVCALYLVRGGWRVLVVEAADEIGGGLRSGAVTLEGFCHDRYATNLALFAASPAFRDYKAEFESLGVRFLRGDKAYASVHGGRALRVYNDAERTERDFAAFDPEDGRGWHELIARFRRTAPHFLPLFSIECPSASMMRQLGNLLKSSVRDTLWLARLCRQSSGALAGDFVRSPEARGLIASWGYHLDFGPDTPGGALFAFVAAASAHVTGMPIAEGGAGRVTSALRTLIERSGGAIMTGRAVTRVVTRSGAAAAVQLADGRKVSAGRAVVANVTPPHLFGRLVSPDDLPGGFASRIRQFRYGPGTFILHLALDRMPQWRAADDLGGFNYIHLNGSEAEIAQTYAQSLAGVLPARPLLVVSQTTTVDPSRAPPGKHVMRVHVRTVPARFHGDAADRIRAESWSSAKEPFAERLLDLVAEHAPDIRDCIIGRAIETPEDIERINPNFVGGDCVSGSHHLGQNFLCRPAFGWSRYATPVKKLYMIGASTWPGGGVNAGSGYLLAKRLIASANPVTESR